MNSNGNKEPRLHSVHSGDGGNHPPLDRLRSKFGIPTPPTAPIKAPVPPVVAVAERQHPEPLPETYPQARTPHGFTTDCVIVVADADAYTDKAMRGPVYMWTWICAETWHYVADFPIPERGKK